MQPFPSLLLVFGRDPRGHLQGFWILGSRRFHQHEVPYTYAIFTMHATYTHTRFRCTLSRSLPWDCTVNDPYSSFKAPFHLCCVVHRDIWTVLEFMLVYAVLPRLSITIDLDRSIVIVYLGRSFRAWHRWAKSQNRTSLDSLIVCSLQVCSAVVQYVQRNASLSRPRIHQ